MRQAFSKQHNFLDLSQFTETRKFASLIENAACMAGYRPMNGEPDIGPAIELATAKSIACALPRVEGRTVDISFRSWAPGDPIEQAEFGFEQPAASAPIAKPDLILVPLVGFTRRLDRLGNGMGHYDRALAAHPAAIRVGIAWSVQEVAHFDVEPWDMPLDAVLTEREWITGERSRIPHG